MIWAVFWCNVFSYRKAGVPPRNDVTALPVLTCVRTFELLAVFLLLFEVAATYSVISNNLHIAVAVNAIAMPYSAIPTDAEFLLNKFFINYLNHTHLVLSHSILRAVIWEKWVTECQQLIASQIFNGWSISTRGSANVLKAPCIRVWVTFQDLGLSVFSPK